MKLTKKVKKILVDDQVKMRICLELGIAYITFKRWINDDHDNLMKKATINTLMKFTGLTEDEIFETEKTN